MLKLSKRTGLILLSLLCLLLCSCAAPQTPADDGRVKVVATVFPAYDFARAAAGEDADVTMLLPPGTESHSYEPTPADIIAVQNCDLFIYLGGESDAWVDTILEATEPKGTVLRMIDCVELLEEEEVEGMMEEPGHSHEHDHEEEEHDHDHGEGEVVGLDEHVWTAPLNAAAITRTIGEKLGTIRPEHAEDYRSRAEAYAMQLEQLDGRFRDFFVSLKDRTMIFGDRFPLRYFAHTYDVRYYAAFPGCSTQTEPSAATVAFLINKVQEEQLSTIWYIEFSNHLVADSIAEAAGAETAQFHTCHNVARADIDAGATYLSIMEGNLQLLQERMH